MHQCNKEVILSKEGPVVLFDANGNGHKTIDVKETWEGMNVFSRGPVGERGCSDKIPFYIFYSSNATTLK